MQYHINITLRTSQIGSKRVCKKVMKKRHPKLFIYIFYVITFWDSLSTQEQEKTILTNKCGN